MGKKSHFYIISIITAFILLPVTGLSAGGYGLGICTSINLTKEQMKRTQLFDTFKLTKGQLQKLRKIDPKTHEWVLVLTSDYDTGELPYPQCVYLGRSDRGVVAHMFLGERIFFGNRPRIEKSISGRSHRFGYYRDGTLIPDEVGDSKEAWRKGDLVVYDCPKYFNSLKIRKEFEKIVKEAKAWATPRGVKVGRYINGNFVKENY